jgi:predicted GTPase
MKKTISKETKYSGTIYGLAANNSAFNSLVGVDIIKSDHIAWERDFGSRKAFYLDVSFIGKTGYGKSTTINKITGVSAMNTNEMESCTKSVQSVEFMIDYESYLSFTDFPGVGESTFKDESYIDLYVSLTEKSHVIVHVLRGDTRDYSIDLKVINDYVGKFHEKIILAINYCDKIEPINRSEQNRPTEKQLENIIKKIEQIRSMFGDSYNIIAYSAGTGWNISELSRNIALALKKGVH